MLSAQLDCAFLRIDTIEQALRDLCGVAVEGEGYRLSYRIASDNLKLGKNVVADSCNPIELTRREWNAVADDAGCSKTNIEVICSDKQEHRLRVESRTTDIPGLILPTWQQVEDREYHDWTMDRIVIDTAGTTPEASFTALLQKLEDPNVAG